MSNHVDIKLTVLDMHELSMGRTHKTICNNVIEFQFELQETRSPTLGRVYTIMKQVIQTIEGMTASPGVKISQRLCHKRWSHPGWWFARRSGPRRSVGWKLCTAKNGATMRQWLPSEDIEELRWGTSRSERRLWRLLWIYRGIKWLWFTPQAGQSQYKSWRQR